MDGDLEVSHGRLVDAPFAQVVEKAEAALQKEGFGVLTRIDVQATLKEKIGEDMPPYLILGACNPPFAHRALQIAPEVGVFMPCNVVVRDTGDGQIRVDAMNVELMSAMIPGEEINGLAHEINHRLQRVLEAL
jgi:uncharacterized protein (DUF302 family)